MTTFKARVILALTFCNTLLLRGLLYFATPCILLYILNDSMHGEDVITKYNNNNNEAYNYYKMDYHNHYSTRYWWRPKDKLNNEVFPPETSPKTVKFPLLHIPHFPSGHPVSHFY